MPGTAEEPTAQTSSVTPAPSDPEVRERPDLGWTEIAVALVSYVVLALGVGVVAVLLIDGRPPTLLTVGFSALAALAASLIAVAVRVRSLAAIGLRATTLRWLLLGLAAGVVGWLATRGVVLAYVLITGDRENPQQGLADVANGATGGLLALLLLGAVLTPLAEELLFRGVLFGALRRYGTVLATIVSAVLFGLAHGINVVLPAAILLGVLNAVLYARSRSIWPSVVAHAVNNAVVFTTTALVL